MALPRTEGARQLRRDATNFEALLWFELKGRKLGGYKFRRQAPIGPYIADFYAPAARLVVEVDGPIHDQQEAADEERTRYLEARGIRVMRIRADDELLIREAILDAILMACRGGWG
jgi:very-short-patch-repair endonuclease